ncbi:MAG: hypothetical protein ABSF29_09225 [Tepidisphaeraceae bacterium]|jgi:hypothetical protein
MGLTCNIDARGKRARLIGGIVQLAAAIGFAGLWALPTGSRLAWILASLLAVTGAFAIFEARAGWCALRAMGIKTRV